MSIDWLESLDLSVEVPKAQKAQAPKREPFKEMDLSRRYGYRAQTQAPAPRNLPRGSAIESVIIENTELKAKEWAVANKFAATADRARMGAEYRANFIMGLITLAQEI